MDTQQTSKTEMRYAVDISAGDKVLYEGAWYTVGGFGQNGPKAQMFLFNGPDFARRIEFHNPHGRKFEVAA